MSQSIKQRVGSMAVKLDAEEHRKLLEAILTDLAVLRTPTAATIVDYAAGRAEVVKLVTDLTATRAEAVKLVTDLTATRAEVVKLVTDLTAARTFQNNKVLTSAGLTIAAGKKTATAANAFFFVANATAGYKAAGDMSALVGTIADGFTAGWAFYIDSAGTITTSAKTADVASVALAAADLLALARPANLAVIGYLIVSTAAAAFIGGTTDLDAVTATDVYFSLTSEDKALAALTAVAPAAMTAVAPAAMTAVAPAAVTAVTPAALTLVA